MELSDRPVDWFNVQVLRRVRNECVAFMTGSQDEVSIEDQALWFARLDHTKVKAFLYYDEGGTPIGYGMLTFDGKGRATTSHGLVEAARGKGVGTQILRDLIDKARELGADHMHAEIFKTNKASLIPCYKLGYVDIADNGDTLELRLDL